MTIRQIADELGISLGQAGELLKGVKADGTIEAPVEKKPASLPMLITRENSAKLYALAIDEGFQDVNDWITHVLLPWHKVKRDFEWKLRLKIDPAEFAAFIETAMTDSIELKQMKARLANMSGQETVPAPSVQPSNKGEVKPQ